MPSMDGGGVEKNLIIVSNFLSRYIKNLTLITFDDGFNKKFSKISAENFIKKIIYEKISPQSLSVSNNFRYGRKRRGNVNLLKKFSYKYNYRLLNILVSCHRTH